MVSTWQKAVFAWSFGMVWGFCQAVVQVIYRNFFFDRFYMLRGENARILRNMNEQPVPEPELTKEEQESLDEIWPEGESREPSDDEYVSAARYNEEQEKCDRMYRKAEAEYLEVLRTTAPGDPVRERYRPKPYPSNDEIKRSFHRQHGMFTN